MIGLWFHSFTEDGAISWQGKVIDQVNEDVYLCQLFEWLTGSANVKRLARLEVMMQWDFYSDEEQMKCAYENRGAR